MAGIAVAVGNLVAQAKCAVAWDVLLAKDEVKHAEKGEIIWDGRRGRYDTGGRMFTREAWACSIKALFYERKSQWAGKACDDLVSSFILSFPTQKSPTEPKLFEFSICGYIG